jgi:hypothetical protein
MYNVEPNVETIYEEMILLLNDTVRICDHLTTDPQGLHFERPRTSTATF